MPFEDMTFETTEEPGATFTGQHFSEINAEDGELPRYVRELSALAVDESTWLAWPDMIITRRS